MEKKKLISVRINKGFTQQQIAIKLNMDVSSYNRREKGVVKIIKNEWEKLSKILEISIEEIYESEENIFFILKDSTNENLTEKNNFYTIPEYLLENQRKYIQKLEEENQDLKNKKNKEE